MIVEVKTSVTARPTLRRQRLRRSIQRIGLVDQATAHEAADFLHASQGDGLHPVFATPQAVVGTVLVCPQKRINQALLADYTHVIGLEDCLKFIRRRMKKYATEKEASRLMFPDELIQFLAWEAGLPE
ncbi:hypothetical protein [Deinococcus multiflagellatus]|uniref:hypothetical protein n=1 Tax=Deinococcus multiflagellatus TaxID=1656887 RepID=UPI001CCD5532|nr:hypothetical protein [Deinococcus multiflagellatus]MBZ9715594.1 hypothetical protein [Deinococcus multiflagellatus]